LLFANIALSSLDANEPIFLLFVDDGVVVSGVLLLELRVDCAGEAAAVVVDVVAFRLFDAAFRLTMQQISH
jgi:hypothetical protein